MTPVRLPYPIGTNRLWTIVRGRLIVSNEAMAWKNEVALRMRNAGVRLLAGPIDVSLVLHPRLTARGKPSKTRLDVDAPIKPVLDALQGIAYVDDKQVVRVSSEVGQPVLGGGLSISINPIAE